MTRYVQPLAALGVIAMWANLAAAQAGNGFDLSWSSIDGGAGTALQGADWTLDGTAGQPDAASSHGDSLVLNGGFWVTGEASAPTPTPISTATPTGTPEVCAGDCDRNEAVQIHELVLGMSIALANGNLVNCSSFDLNSSGNVEIDELITAVGNALLGCDR